jgi:hypothetical protein
VTDQRAELVASFDPSAAAQPGDVLEHTHAVAERGVRAERARDRRDLVGVERVQGWSDVLMVGTSPPR